MATIAADTDSTIAEKVAFDEAASPVSEDNAVVDEIAVDAGVVEADFVEAEVVKAEAGIVDAEIVEAEVVKAEVVEAVAETAVTETAVAETVVDDDSEQENKSTGCDSDYEETIGSSDSDDDEEDDDTDDDDESDTSESENENEQENEQVPYDVDALVTSLNAATTTEEIVALMPKGRQGLAAARDIVHTLAPGKARIILFAHLLGHLRLTSNGDHKMHVCTLVHADMLEEEFSDLCTLLSSRRNMGITWFLTSKFANNYRYAEAHALAIATREEDSEIREEIKSVLIQQAVHMRDLEKLARVMGRSDIQPNVNMALFYEIYESNWQAGFEYFKTLTSPVEEAGRCMMQAIATDLGCACRGEMNSYIEKCVPDFDVALIAAECVNCKNCKRSRDLEDDEPVSKNVKRCCDGDVCTPADVSDSSCE